MNARAPSAMGFDDVVEHFTWVAPITRRRVGRYMRLRAYSECACGWVGPIRTSIFAASNDGSGHEARTYIDSFGGR